MLRVFFALLPNASLQASLGVLAREVAARVDGRAIPDANIHLTLAFIGELRPERVDALRAALHALPRAAFDLSLDRLGVFRDAEVAWIAPSNVPTELVALQSALVAALSVQRFGVDDRPFHAHVTLARRCTRRITRTSFTPIVWRVDRAALMRSTPWGDGVRYEALDSIELA